MIDPRHRATPEDGKEILRILESSAATGSVELLYTRRPDAYESYQQDFGEAQIFISRNGDRVVGTAAELIREVYVGGEPSKAAYLCGLKKDAAHEGGVGFGARFIKSLQRDDVDVYYFSVIADNLSAQTMFGKGKRLVSMEPFAEFTTHILSPRVKIQAPRHALCFRQAEEHDLPRLLAFLNEEGRRRDLFPVIRNIGQFHGLTEKDFYLLEDGGELLAAAALWNQTDYKQYVVKRYRGLMKLARLANPLLSRLGYIKLPRADEPLNFPMLAFFLCRGDDETHYRIFLDEIRKVIGKRYGMFVIGLPKNHFAAPLIQKLPGIRFDTKLYSLSFPWSSRPLKPIDHQTVYPECGLL